MICIQERGEEASVPQKAPLLSPQEVDHLTACAGRDVRGSDETMRGPDGAMRGLEEDSGPRAYTSGDDSLASDSRARGRSAHRSSPTYAAAAVPGSSWLSLQGFRTTTLLVSPLGDLRKGAWPAFRWNFTKQRRDDARVKLSTGYPQGRDGSYLKETERDREDGAIGADAQGRNGRRMRDVISVAIPSDWQRRSRLDNYKGKCVRCGKKVYEDFPYPSRDRCAVCNRKRAAKLEHFNARLLNLLPKE